MIKFLICPHCQEKGKSRHTKRADSVSPNGDVYTVIWLYRCLNCNQSFFKLNHFKLTFIKSEVKPDWDPEESRI